MNSKLINSIIKGMKTEDHNISHVQLFVPLAFNLKTDIFIDYLKEKFKLSDLVFDVNAEYKLEDNKIIIDNYVYYYFKLVDKYHIIITSDGSKEIDDNFYNNDNLEIDIIDIYFDKTLNTESVELLDYINKKIILKIKNNLGN